MSNVNRFMHWLVCMFSIVTGVSAIWISLAVPSHAKNAGPLPWYEGTALPALSGAVLTGPALSRPALSRSADAG